MNNENIKTELINPDIDKNKKPKENIKENKLYITIKTTDNVLYQGYAESLMSYNDYGVFSILPLHANFITIIKTSITVLKDKNEKLDFKIDSGIMQITENRVDIFLGIESI